MTSSTPLRPRPPVALLLLIAAQLFCAAFFVYDILHDVVLGGMVAFHASVEMIAAIVFALTIGFEVRYIAALRRQRDRFAQVAARASAAIEEAIEAHFVAWRLTPSEHDIAHLTVKGLPIAEIARIRGSAEGTVKSHLNAIYRKSGSQNRSELLSHIIDSLMDRDARTIAQTTG